MHIVCLLLAHLSRRLIGELIVYEGIRPPSVVRSSGFTNEHILVTLHVIWTNVGYICAIGYPILGMLNYLSEIAFMTHWLQCQISFSYPK